MIDYDLLAQWLNAVPTELGHQFIVGPREPEFQIGDLVGLITPLPGPGLTLDGLGNAASFELKVVAREYQRAALRRVAFSYDRALLFGDASGPVWGTQVQWVDRVGGEPAPLQQDEQDRVAYACSYVVHETPEI